MFMISIVCILLLSPQFSDLRGDENITHVLRPITVVQVPQESLLMKELMDRDGWSATWRLSTDGRVLFTGVGVYTYSVVSGEPLQPWRVRYDLDSDNPRAISATWVSDAEARAGQDTETRIFREPRVVHSEHVRLGWILARSLQDQSTAPLAVAFFDRTVSDAGRISIVSTQRAAGTMYDRSLMLSENEAIVVTQFPIQFWRVTPNSGTMIVEQERPPNTRWWTVEPRTQTLIALDHDGTTHVIAGDGTRTTYRTPDPLHHPPVRVLMVRGKPVWDLKGEGYYESHLVVPMEDGSYRTVEGYFVRGSSPDFRYWLLERKSDRTVWRLGF